jgi:hypothetical protein
VEALRAAAPERDDDDGLRHALGPRSDTSRHADSVKALNGDETLDVRQAPHNRQVVDELQKEEEEDVLDDAALRPPGGKERTTRRPGLAPGVVFSLLRGCR